MSKRIVTLLTDECSALWQRFVDSANLEFFVHADDVPPVGAEVPG